MPPPASSHAEDDQVRDAPLHILVVEDEQSLAIACQRSLSREGHEVDVRTDPQAGYEVALRDTFDIILLDLNLPTANGMEMLQRIKGAGVRAEIVIMTGSPTVQTAVDSMKLGAADYLCKPFTWTELRLTLEKASRRSALIRENAMLRRELEVERGFEGILGESQAMQRVFSVLRRVAPTDGTVLITGESGTGKEMIARAVHRLSRRGDKPLLPCDCSALAPSLLESELFGHEKGSFSGAIATKEGLFEAANGGTLFLDEVANLTHETQGKLLRVLESKRVRKVGGTAELPIDIRLVAATNRSLAGMVADGSFREDLFYRLNVVPIDLPALRERRGDIPLLANEFLRSFRERAGAEVQGFTAEAMTLLENYRWPGNVRELRNIVERVVILCDATRVESHHLPVEIRGASLHRPPTELPETWEEFKAMKSKIREAAVRDVERRFLRTMLEKHDGNVSEAARRMGMQRTNLHALLKRHGMTARRMQ